MIESLNIRFLLSNMYFDGTEHDIIKLFGQNEETYIFPHKFNSIHNFDFNGFVPDLKYYIDSKDSQIGVAEKEIFVNQLRESNYIFCMAKETERYCEQKVLCLAKGCLTFIKEIVNFQVILEESCIQKVLYFCTHMATKRAQSADMFLSYINCII